MNAGGVTGRLALGVWTMWSQRVVDHELAVLDPYGISVLS
jgi:hypothetical protein